MGHSLATASHDGSIRCWDVASWTPRFEIRGHGGFVYSIAFAPDSRSLITAGDDLTTRVWDLHGRAIWNVATGETELELIGHRAMIGDAKWSPDGPPRSLGCWSGVVFRSKFVTTPPATL